MAWKTPKKKNNYIHFDKVGLLGEDLKLKWILELAKAHAYAQHIAIVYSYNP